MSEPSRLTIEPIQPNDGGRPGDHWLAALDINGSPAYDGTGPTIEAALAALILQFGASQAVLEEPQ